MPYLLARTDREIEDQLNAAMEQEDKGDTKWPGMTYEQGVANALQWIIGHNDSAPMED